MQTGVQSSAVPQAIWFANHPSACRLAPWLSWLKRLLVNRRSWVRIPAVPLEGELEHHLGLVFFFYPRTECQWGCRGAPVPLAIWFANHPSAACQRMLDPAGRRGITGQCACLVNRRSWVRIPAVPLEGVLEHHLGLSGFSIRETECKRVCRVAPVPQAIWFANHPSACRLRRGLVG